MTIKPYTNQTAYTKSVKHLLSMKEPAMADDECAYRTEGGSMCAIGALIPDSLYTEDMEGAPADSAISMVNPLKRIFKSVDKGMLEDLQDLHDNIGKYFVFSPSSWTKNKRGLKKSSLKKLVEIAADYGVEPPKELLDRLK